MNNILVFKVEVENLEKKIYRIIEIDSKKTVADLAYTVLASFDSLAFQLYEIRHGNNRYDCMVSSEGFSKDGKQVDATKTKLGQVDFSKNNEMKMNYDHGSTVTFKISYEDRIEIKEVVEEDFPRIKDGAGHGILENIDGCKLIEIVKETDEMGESKYDFSPVYQRECKYDYREYSLAEDNIKVRADMRMIKSGYERRN